MDKEFSLKIQKWAAWSGIGFCIVYGITFIVLPHNYPPADPTFTGQELVDNWYLKYQWRILLGQSLSAATGILYLIWCTQLTVQMWHREPAPILSLLQLGGGILTTWVVMFPPVMWAWCAENAGIADPEMIKMVHFNAWYLYDMTYWITTVECIALFLIIMYDKKKPRLMPKWAAWLALAAGLIFIPLTVIPYFKTGPFALNGWINFHAVFILYGLFTAVSSYYMVVDLKRNKINSPQGMGNAIKL